MSGDPMREYLRQARRDRRREIAWRAVGVALMILSAFVVLLFAWALTVYLLGMA